MKRLVRGHPASHPYCLSHLEILMVLGHVFQPHTYILDAAEAPSFSQLPRGEIKHETKVESYSYHAHCQRASF